MTGTLLNRGGSRGSVVIIDASDDTSTTYDARSGITYGAMIPGGFEGTSISFEVSSEEGDPFAALNDEAGTPVAVAVSDGENYTLPAALAPWPYFRIVSNATESAERAIRIVGKR